MLHATSPPAPTPYDSLGLATMPKVWVFLVLEASPTSMLSSFAFPAAVKYTTAFQKIRRLSFPSLLLSSPLLSCCLFSFPHFLHSLIHPIHLRQLPLAQTRHYLYALPHFNATCRSTRIIIYGVSCSQPRCNDLKSSSPWLAIDSPIGLSTITSSKCCSSS